VTNKHLGLPGGESSFETNVAEEGRGNRRSKRGDDWTNTVKDFDGWKTRMFRRGRETARTAAARVASPGGW